MAVPLAITQAVSRETRLLAMAVDLATSEPTAGAGGNRRPCRPSARGGLAKSSRRRPLAGDGRSTMTYRTEWCRPAVWASSRPRLWADVMGPTAAASAVPGSVATVGSAGRQAANRWDVRSRPDRPSDTAWSGPPCGPNRARVVSRQYRTPGLVVRVGFSRYCWTRSTIGMMVGGCASSMPSSSITGPRYVRNSSNASWLSQTSKT